MPHKYLQVTSIAALHNNLLIMLAVVIPVRKSSTIQRSNCRKFQKELISASVVGILQHWLPWQKVKLCLTSVQVVVLIALLQLTGLVKPVRLSVLI